MIVWASRSMIPALQEMWVECFGDSSEYVRHIFQVLQKPERMLVYTDATGSPLAMLSFVPMTLQTPEKEYAAAYIYAVATATAQRGKGISTELLQEANIRLAEEGCCASVLVPASMKLFGFYASRGYETCFHTRRAHARTLQIAGSAGPCTLYPAPFERFLALRNRIYGDCTLYARWDFAYLRAIEEECRFLGGEVLGVSYPGGSGFAVCYHHQDTVYVKELAVPAAQIEPVLAALHQRYRAVQYTLYLRADDEVSVQNTLLPFGMVRWYDKKYKQALAGLSGRAAYIAHVLD